MAAALIIGGAFTLSGASVALAYPPEETTPTTEVSPEQASRAPSSSVATLPSTGSDSTMSVLLIGGGLLGSGALLVGGTRRRRA